MILNKKDILILIILLGIFAIIIVRKYKENQDYKTYRGDYPVRPETGNIDFYKIDTSINDDNFQSHK